MPSPATTALLNQLHEARGNCYDNLPDMLDGSFTPQQVSEECAVFAALSLLLANDAALLLPHLA